MNGEVRDNVAAGVLEPAVSKVRSLKSAFEAAVSLLRIDDAIQCAPGAYRLESLTLLTQKLGIYVEKKDEPGPHGH